LTAGEEVFQGLSLLSSVFHDFLGALKYPEDKSRLQRIAKDLKLTPLLHATMERYKDTVIQNYLPPEK